MSARLLAAQLETRRNTLGWSIAVLADRAGYHENTILRALHGENVQVRTLEDIAGALGLAVALVSSRTLKPQSVALRGDGRGWTLTSNATS